MTRPDGKEIYSQKHAYLLNWLYENEEMMRIIQAEGYTKIEAIELLKLMALQRGGTGL